MFNTGLSIVNLPWCNWKCRYKVRGLNFCYFLFPAYVNRFRFLYFISNLDVYNIYASFYLWGKCINTTTYRFSMFIFWVLSNKDIWIQLFGITILENKKAKHYNIKGIVSVPLCLSFVKENKSSTYKSNMAGFDHLNSNSDIIYLKWTYTHHHLR